jgi:hypothetical protein
MRTYRLAHVTLSSTESELSATCEASTYVEWIIRLGTELMLARAEEPIVLEQDNSASIKMNEVGGGTFKRSKHIMIRSSFIDEILERKCAVLEWTPTADMIADLGTKVHDAARIAHLLKLMHVIDTDDQSVVV